MDRLPWCYFTGSVPRPLSCFLHISSFLNFGILWGSILVLFSNHTYALMTFSDTQIHVFPLKHQTPISSWLHSISPWSPKGYFRFQNGIWGFPKFASLSSSKSLSMTTLNFELMQSKIVLGSLLFFFYSCLCGGLQKDHIKMNIVRKSCMPFCCFAPK